MTFSPVITNTASDVDQVNGNYRHVGRCGFSTFYGMDSSGDYVAQPFGSASQPWLSAHIGTLSIITNTIASTGVNAPIVLTPNGTARVEMGRVLGAWVIDSHTVGTDYLAATDLFVVAHIDVGNQQGWAIEGYTDSNSTPTQLITRDSANLRLDGGNTTFVNYGSITFPVKKGDYWRVDQTAISAASGPTDLVINLIPLGA